MLAPIAFMLATVPPTDVVNALATSTAREAVGVSFSASLIAVIGATVLGVPAGYGLANIGGPWRSALLFVLALPLAFPPIASGIILLNAVSTRSAFGAFLFAHGLILVDTLLGVALAEFFVSGSLVAVTACAAFRVLDPIYVESAKTLGASSIRIFWSVALPLALPNVTTGILLAWLRAVGEYGATSILAYHPTSLPVALYVTLSAQGLREAVALSYGFVFLAAIIVALQWCIRRRVV
ncbi:MAG: ABC transporter permease subunit [Candidatus Eremiobacteraeota bacterium]|nr:ABC transporter permease subunit [Candidatus Eremiobacteraeota bacterium]